MPASLDDVKGPDDGFINTSIPDTPLERPAATSIFPESAGDDAYQMTTKAAAPVEMASDSDESQSGLPESQERLLNGGEEQRTDTPPERSASVANSLESTDDDNSQALDLREGHDGLFGETTESRYDGGGKIRTYADKKYNRKSNKPKMEKKRRERMNVSFQEIKTLVCEGNGKNPAQYPKQEKAAILEMAVEYLRGVKDHRPGIPVPVPDGGEGFRRGYDECKKETERIMKSEMGINPNYLSDFMDHLTKHQAAAAQRYEAATHHHHLGGHHLHPQLQQDYRTHPALAFRPGLAAYPDFQHPAIRSLASSYLVPDRSGVFAARSYALPVPPPPLPPLPPQQALPGARPEFMNHLRPYDRLRLMYSNLPMPPVTADSSFYSAYATAASSAASAAAAAAAAAATAPTAFQIPSSARRLHNEDVLRDLTRSAASSYISSALVSGAGASATRPTSGGMALTGCTEMRPDLDRKPSDRGVTGKSPRTNSEGYSSLEASSSGSTPERSAETRSSSDRRMQRSSGDRGSSSNSDQTPERDSRPEGVDVISSGCPGQNDDSCEAAAMAVRDDVNVNDARKDVENVPDETWRPWSP